MHEALCAAIDGLRLRLFDGETISAHARVTHAEDLAALSHSFQAKPIQISAGKLLGSTCVINIDGLEICYILADQTLLFEDSDEIIGACLISSPTGDRFVEVGDYALFERPAGYPTMFVGQWTQDIRPPTEGTLPSPPVIPDRARTWDAISGLMNDVTASQSSGEVELCSAKIAAVLDAFSAHLASNQRNRAGYAKYRNVVDLIKLVDETQEFSVERIAHILKVPRRTLHDNAMRNLGIGPKRLAKRVGLRNVMYAIPTAAATGQSIGDLAFSHGFESFPHFSTDFRALFGERPSDILKRHACS